MADFSKRSLRKAVEKLTDAEEAFLLKYTCEVNGCGSDFQSEIARGALEQKNGRTKRYTGRCVKCAKSVVLSQSKYAVWTRLIEGSKLTITDTTFDALFEK